MTTLWFSSDEVSELWYGDDEVSVGWFATDKVFDVRETDLPVTEGRAFRVGFVRNFGASGLNFLSGLAELNGTLYGVSFHSSYLNLYSFTDWNSKATEIGPLNGIRTPTGLTGHKGRLYCVDTNTDALFTIDVTTGQGTQVGSAVEFGIPGLRNPNAMASDGNRLIMFQGSGEIYEVDDTTGVATLLLNVQTPQGGVWSSAAFHDGKLYAATSRSRRARANRLYTINLAGSGQSAAERVGSLNRFGQPGNADFATGMTSHRGRLYLVTLNPESLWTIDARAPLPPVYNYPPLVARNSRVALFTLTANDQWAIYQGAGFPSGQPSETSVKIGDADLVDRLSRAEDYWVQIDDNAPVKLGKANNIQRRGSGVDLGYIGAFIPGLSDGEFVTTGTVLKLYDRDPAIRQRPVSLGQSSLVGGLVRAGNAYGITASQDTIYLLSATDRSRYLYTVDELTGAATQVSTSRIANVGSYSLAWHENKLWAVTETGHVVTINPTTGVGTQVIDQHTLTIRPTGLTSHEGELWAITDTGVLWTINTTTLAETSIGLMNASLIDNASGLASYAGQLYTFDTQLQASNMRLVSPNREWSIPRGNAPALRSLTGFEDKLYAIDSGSLYTIT